MFSGRLLDSCVANRYVHTVEHVESWELNALNSPATLVREEGDVS